MPEWNLRNYWPASNKGNTLKTVKTIRVYMSS